MRGVTIGAALAAALCMQATAAHATATLLCSIKDKSFEFVLQGAVGSIASSLSGLQGEIDMKAAGAEPARKVELNADNLVQRWIEGQDLKLWLHGDHDDKTPDFDLIIEAKRKTKTSGNYSGAFRMNFEGAKGPRKFAGKASCSID